MQNKTNVTIHNVKLHVFYEDDRWSFYFILVLITLIKSPIKQVHEQVIHCNAGVLADTSLDPGHLVRSYVLIDLMNSVKS